MEDLYITILNWVRQTPNREKYITVFCKKVPYITAFGYICILSYLIYMQDTRIYITILKPLTTFIVVTIFRKIINRPRPYETLNIIPLFKHKKGESFPSRHSASAFIIALVCYSILPYFGIFLLIIASLVAMTRIIAGVHYISDVLVAISISIIIWIL